MIITNETGLPQPFVDAVTSDHEYKPKRYSVTDLIGGVKQAVLKHRHSSEITQDASEMVWLLFGKAVHSILESSVETPEQVKECKLAIDMGDGYELSGIFDLYDSKTQTVYDYKTASVWKHMFGEWDDYRRQLAAYAWMIEECGFPCKHGEVVAFYKDHSKTDAARKEGYPPHPVERIRFDFQDLAGTEDWIRENFEAIRRAEQMDDDEIPTCTEEERWHKPDKWAVKKSGAKRAVRVLDSEEAAEAFKGDDPKLEIEFRKGEDTRCLKYCQVAAFCDHGRKCMEGKADA